MIYHLLLPQWFYRSISCHPLLRLTSRDGVRTSEWSEQTLNENVDYMGAFAPSWSHKLITRVASIGNIVCLHRLWFEVTSSYKWQTINYIIFSYDGVYSSLHLCLLSLLSYSPIVLVRALTAILSRNLEVVWHGAKAWLLGINYLADEITQCHP